MNADPDSVLVRAMQAARQYGVPYTTLRDLALRGEIPVVRLGTAWYFDRRDLALEAGVELWHTGIEEPYISIPVAGHVEHQRLQGKSVRGWLARLHHQETGRPPGSQAIKDALTTLSGIACYDGIQHDVHVRVAGHGDAVYVDLGDSTWRAVEITANGWSIIPVAPVRFRRGITIAALPPPEAGGSLDALREVIHVAGDDDWKLVEAWLAGALRPRGPYPLLTLDGEQGAGKSTTARLVRRTIDPSAADLRAEPREIRDLMVAAAGGWIIAFDNVSHLPPWLSDALCRISTGGALSTRSLYTDGDEYVVEAIRPTLITGIAQVVVRGDLQDRSIALTLPAVAADKRRTEAELWRSTSGSVPRHSGRSSTRLPAPYDGRTRSVFSICPEWRTLRFGARRRSLPSDTRTARSSRRSMETRRRRLSRRWRPIPSRWQSARSQCPVRYRRGAVGSDHSRHAPARLAGISSRLVWRSPAAGAAATAGWHRSDVFAANG